MQQKANKEEGDHPRGGWHYQRLDCVELGEGTVTSARQTPIERSNSWPPTVYRPQDEETEITVTPDTIQWLNDGSYSTEMCSELHLSMSMSYTRFNKSSHQRFQMNQSFNISQISTTIGHRQARDRAQPQLLKTSLVREFQQI